MVTAMHHRGPDDQGTFSDRQVSLGMTRLAIIDTTSGGHQPMQTPDGGIVLIYNGELYNFREQRELLEQHGYTFQSSSDTEVVLRLYEHYGDDFLSRMRGMFAVAVYDKRRGPGRERLLLARDQMGIKPLLYAWVGGTLVFASELKGLLASGLIDPEIDPAALRLLLTYGSVYQPRTILRGVQMLLPAHRMVIEGGRQRISRYWGFGLNRRTDFRQKSYDELVDEMAAVLQESVRLQMVSDVPLGAFLSGGVDSSLLVAMMAREVTSGRVRTFSIGFEQEGADIDESDDAQRTADFIGTNHSRVVVTADDLLRRIEHIALALDQPSVDGVNSYFVSWAARQAVTVAISGTGGDELFAGYPWFAMTALSEQRWSDQPAWKSLARAALAPVVRMSIFDNQPSRRIGQLRYTSDFRTRYGGTFNVFGPADSSGLLGDGLHEQAQLGRSAYYDLAETDELARGTVVQRVTSICLRGYTTNQLLRDIDAVSMAHSLEVRVPYLDPVVADAALSLPDNAKLGDVSTIAKPVELASYRELGAKRILLDIGKRMLPRDFDTQPKRGFSMPFNAWLKGRLREVMEDTLSATTVRQRGLFNVDKVRATRENFLAGHVAWPQPWLLMMIELWCRQLIDRKQLASKHAA